MSYFLFFYLQMFYDAITWRVTTSGPVTMWYSFYFLIKNATHYYEDIDWSETGSGVQLL